MKAIDNLTKKIISSHKLTIFVILLITIPMFYSFLQQRHHNEFEIYFDKDSPEMVYYRQFQKIYGNERFVVIAFKDKDLLLMKTSH